MFSRSSTNGGLEAVISHCVQLARGSVLPHKLTAGPSGRERGGSNSAAHTRASMHTLTDTHAHSGWAHTRTHTKKNYMLSIRQAVGAITETWQNTMKQASLSEGK